MDYETLVEFIKSKKPELQEALDNSPYAEKRGACIPMDDLLTVILAIYYYLNQESIQKDDDKNDSRNDWMESSYWDNRILSDDNIDRKNRSKGFSPSNCDFWTPEKDTDGLYNVEGETFYTKKVSEMFDYGGSSHKVFNRIHMYKQDPNFTIGYIHMASGSERDFLVDNIVSNKTIYDEMCQYIVYRLNKKDDNCACLYRLQAANDSEIKKVLFNGRENKIRADEAEKVTIDEWMTAIRHFFSANGILKDGKYTGPLSKKKELSCFAYWAESQMVYYSDKEHIKDYIDPETQNTIEFDTQDFKGGKGALLFQTVNDNPLKCKRRFWFHDIFKDALLLKSIAAEQIKFWKNKYYPKVVNNSKKIFGMHPEAISQNSFLVYGVLSFANWANSAKNVEINSTYDEGTQILTFKEISISSDQFLTSQDEFSDDKLKGIILLSCIRYEMLEDGSDNRSRTKYLIEKHLKNYWQIPVQMSKDTDKSDPKKTIPEGAKFVPLHKNNHLEKQMCNEIRRIGLENNK